uniref:Uncharacterized protein n=1 Tax=Anguilla anguilla TaxID=7936 RepID=A0A0E9U1X6_ANGAN
MKTQHLVTNPGLLIITSFFFFTLICYLIVFKKCPNNYLE